MLLFYFIVLCISSLYTGRFAVKIFIVSLAEYSDLLCVIDLGARFQALTASKIKVPCLRVESPLATRFPLVMALLCMPLIEYDCFGI